MNKILLFFLMFFVCSADIALYSRDTVSPEGMELNEDDQKLGDDDLEDFLENSDDTDEADLVEAEPQALTWRDRLWQRIVEHKRKIAAVVLAAAVAGGLSYYGYRHRDVVIAGRTWPLSSEGLALSEKGLTQLPPRVEKLTRVESINASKNEFTEIPKELEKLSLLKSVNFSNNNLTKVGIDLSKLEKLEYLNLSGNKSINIDDVEWDKLKELRELNLDNCDLKDLPVGIGALEKLEELHLENNNLNEMDPDTLNGIFKSLPANTEIFLRDNRLTKKRLEIIKQDTNVDLRGAILPTDQFPKEELMKVSLYSETPIDPEKEELEISGDIVYWGEALFIDEMSKLKEFISLKRITLRNSMSDKIFDKIIGLPLEELNIVNNYMIKEIPATIGGFEELRKLILLRNYSLTTLPDEIGNLSNLEELDISGCFKLKTLPNSMNKLKNLKKVNLKGTGMSLTELNAALKKLPNGCTVQISKSLYVQASKSQEDLTTEQKNTIKEGVDESITIKYE